MSPWITCKREIVLIIIEFIFKTKKDGGLVSLEHFPFWFEEEQTLNPIYYGHFNYRDAMRGHLPSNLSEILLNYKVDSDNIQLCIDRIYEQIWKTIHNRWIRRCKKLFS